MRRLAHDWFVTLSGVLHLGLMTSFLVLLSTAPFVATVFLIPSVIPLVASGVLLAPAVAASFAVFRAWSEEGDQRVVRTFVASWWANRRRTLMIGAMTSSVVGILVVDMVWAWGHPIGALLIPVLVVAALMAVCTAIAMVAALDDHPRARVRDLLGLSFYATARGWLLSATTVAAILVLLAIIGASPALGLGLATAPVLYVVWANTRLALRQALAGAGLHQPVAMLEGC